MSSLKRRVADFLGVAQMAPAKRVSVASPASSSSDEDSDGSSFDAAGLLATATSSGGAARPPPGCPGAPASAPASPGAPPQHSSHADQGGRPYMEDAHAHAQVAPGAAAFAVFDGHGGGHVAEFCAARLLPHVAAGLRADGAASASGAAPTSPAPEPAAAPEAPAAGAAPEGPAIAAALRGAFDAVDRELQGHQEAHMCGTTAAVCVVTPEWVYTANCGDSRIVLVRPNRAVALTVDHAPSRHDERERVKRAGGKVVWSNGLRVMGALSMTRAIGDHFLRRHGVIPDPEIAATPRTPADEFLILATDGLWNFVSCDEAAAVARRALARAAALPHATAALVVPRALTKLALARGSTDNVTVTYVDLRPSPPVGAPARPGAAAPAATVAGAAKAALARLGALAAGAVPAAAPAPAPAPVPLPVPVPSPAAAEPPAPAPAAGAAAEPAAAAESADAAAPTGPSPFQAPDLQLPSLGLRPIRTRTDGGPEPMALPAAAALRAASEPSMERCRSAALPWEVDGGQSPLAMLRAKSAPVRMHHHTVTTGGPLMPPARAPAAAPPAALAAPAVKPAPLSAAPAACVCSGGAAGAADGASLAARRSAGGQACAAACWLRALPLPGGARLAAPRGAAGAIPVGGAASWGAVSGSMDCDD